MVRATSRLEEGLKIGISPPRKDAEMVPLDQISAQFKGFERLQAQHGSSYKDASTIVIVPTRGMINYRVIQTWQSMISPMNQKKAFIFLAGDEVGEAYNRMIRGILADPELSKWKYILTLEDDNLIPADAHIRLLESIEAGPFDAVGGLYFTKGDVNMPMAYGDPTEFARTGQLDFRPRDIRKALELGAIMEVNGIAMGCSLYRLSLFKDIPAPWFVTVGDVLPETGPQVMTQDLFFCRNARKVGKRFAVDMRVRVGHLDINSGIVY